MDILNIQGITKQYPKFRLDDVRFRVPGGSVVGFIGENGAGKTTTLKAALNLIRPDSGKVEYFGKDVRTLSEREKAGIGMVLDDVCLPDSVKVREISPILSGLIPTWDGERFSELTAAFSLPPDSAVGALSKGMKMKAGLAAALSHRANLLLLDEATSGLDPVARDEVLDLLYAFVKDENHAVLMSSHIVEDLEKICDYVVFIHEGRIVFEKSTDQLREEFALFKGSDEQLRALPPGAVIRIRRTPFSLSALVNRKAAGTRFPLERASLDDIMLFYIKGESR